MSETKPCVACGEQIASSAQLCFKCRSYQDWRRWLPFSSTVLALLTALLSVLTVAIATIVPVLRGHHSLLTASLQAATADSGKVLFLVSNSGDRAGSATEAHFRAGLTSETVGDHEDEIFASRLFSIAGFSGGGFDSGDSSFMTYAVEFPLATGDNWSGFLGPGESRLMQLSLPATLAPSRLTTIGPVAGPPRWSTVLSKPPWSGLKCEVEIRLADFDGVARKDTHSVNCQMILRALWGDNWQYLLTPKKTTNHTGDTTAGNGAAGVASKP